MQDGVVEHVKAAEVNGQLWVVAGRNRVRATIIANEKLAAAGELTRKVPVKIVVKTPQQAMGLNIASNIRVGETDASYLHQFKILRGDGYNYNETDIAQAYGRPDDLQWVRVRLTILENMAPQVLALVMKGVLSVAAAYELRDLSHEEQVTHAQDLAQSGHGQRAEAHQRRMFHKTGKRGIVVRKRKELLRIVSVLESYVTTKRKPPEGAADKDEMRPLYEAVLFVLQTGGEVWGKKLKPYLAADEASKKEEQKAKKKAKKTEAEKAAKKERRKAAASGETQEPSGETQEPSGETEASPTTDEPLDGALDASEIPPVPTDEETAENAAA